MKHPTISLIERRVSANHFDASFTLTNAEIERLVDAATRAPTAYNFQNWRFVAVRGTQSKERLRALAYGQTKVADAGVTFIVCGVLPDHEVLRERLRPFVEAGFMSAATAAGWCEAARQAYADAQKARDEAVRSAALGAATLIYAAEAMDLATGPIGGFDAAGVASAFGLAPNELPVLLVAVGRPACGNWPQKPRRPVSEVLEIA